MAAGGERADIGLHTITLVTIVDAAAALEGGYRVVGRKGDGLELVGPSLGKGGVVGRLERGRVVR